MVFEVPAAQLSPVVGTVTVMEGGGGPTMVNWLLELLYELLEVLVTLIV